MWWKWIKQQRISGRRLVCDESGQSLIIVAFAIIALLAIIGLGVDLGLAFVERVRLARAMDAAALAGAQELPAELPAHLRALEYLEENGFDTVEACIETLGSDIGACPNPSASTHITIDTQSYRNPNGDLNSANKIEVSGSKDVRMAFIRVIKTLEHIKVGAGATAENIEDLDIVIVYDRSGSMQEDTRCYGCWEPDSVVPIEDYPAGQTYPLPFVDPDTGNAVHCEPSDPLDYGGRWYVTIEAEHYSRYLTEADYHRDWTEYPKTWWSMHRQPNVNASGPDERGAFMKVGPHSQDAAHYSYVINPPDFWTTPRLDYDFTVPANGTYYVWIRAQGGVNWWADATLRRQVFVGLNGGYLATEQTDRYGPYGADGQAADAGSWRWTRVPGSLNLSATGPADPYTLNIWASGPGFSLDKIVITNNSDSGLASRAPLNWTHKTVPNGGPTESHGRTDWACMGADDPRFAPVDPLSGELDDLYDDAQPIRAAKEAAKKFVRRLDPELDQIGYVWYSNSGSIREELYCLKRYGGCADFEPVVAKIESTYAQGGTNIADAMWQGLRVLITGRESGGGSLPPKSVGAEHYGRARAAHIMIVMTDGQANVYPGLPSGYGNCYSDELWPDVPGESTDQRRARECVAWFALRARDQGVVVYTIGLGAQADNELLAHVAQVTGGGYYFAPSGEELDAIFEALYEQIFLRLID